MLNGGPGGRKGTPPQKSKNFFVAMKRLFSELHGLIIPMIIACIFATGGSLVMIFAPDIVSDLTDEIAKAIPGLPVDFGIVVKLAIILAIMYVVGALLNLFEQLLMAWASTRFGQELRNRISKKINRLPLSYFDKNQTGDILSRVTHDVDLVAQSLNQSLSTLISEAALLIGAAVAMILTNFQIAAVAIGASLVGFATIGIILSASQKYFIMRQEELGKINSHNEQIYSGLLVVKP